MECMKAIINEVSLDLWICHHFRVLPTEGRFKRLTENQKRLLFYSFQEMPTDDELIMDVRIREDAERQALPPDDLIKLGYTQEQIDRILHNIAIAKAKE